MDRKQQVLLRLKLKAKALGFNVKELKGIAAKIADNLASEEDASDEDVNAEIDTQIDAVLPYLSVGQSQANRLLDEWKKNHPETDDDDDDDNDDTPISTGRQAGSNKKNPKNKKEEEAPSWAKGIIDTVNDLKNEVTTLKGEKVISGRKSKLESLLKDTGSFGTRTLKSFNKMKFDSEDEFDEFYAEVEEDLKAHNKERAEAGLSIGIPAGASGEQRKKEEVLTDEEVIALAKGS